MPTPSHHHQAASAIGWSPAIICTLSLSFGWWWWYRMVCLVTARLICLQLKGGSPVFSSSVTTIHTCAGRLGLDWGDYTLTTDNTCNCQIKTMMYVLIERLRSVVRPLDCCNYNPEISARAPVVKMIAVTSWEIFLYLMISWEWPHTQWFPACWPPVSLPPPSLER